MSSLSQIMIYHRDGQNFMQSISGEKLDKKQL
ncbi:hypothetical protein BpHYR1_029342 [Brachionus plicatilis]|uniref:Uncharacterized protein n=1 Tax=Brachionus plicatilis TaxID=10195 RepID=A0A3M7PDG5_BRAPC|nr:hypothetical protein BpHYR1_029342 [Brachionus plicatilis]